MRLYTLLVYTLLVYIVLTPSVYSIQLTTEKYDRLVGVQIFNFDPTYQNDLDSYFYELKSQNINCIIVRVFHNKGDRYHFSVNSDCDTGVYFKTNVACSIKDILPDIISHAKFYGIKVYAWMATRSLSFLKEEFGLEKRFTYKNKSEKGYGVNIFDGRVRNKIIKLFRDLALYDIDGILIQDDFILKYNEGASAEAVKRFKVDCGQLATYNTLFYKNNTKKELFYIWNRWKTEQLNYFLDEIIMEVKKIDPGIDFAINIFYETPTMPAQALEWYSQSLNRIFNSNIKYYSIMLYHEQIAQEMKLNFLDTAMFINNTIRKLANDILNNERVIAKIQIRSFKDKSTFDVHEMNAICGIIQKYDNMSFFILPFEKIEDKRFICNN